MTRHATSFKTGKEEHGKRSLLSTCPFKDHHRPGERMVKVSGERVRESAQE